MKCNTIEKFYVFSAQKREITRPKRTEDKKAIQLFQMSFKDVHPTTTGLDCRYKQVRHHLLFIETERLGHMCVFL